LTNSAPWKFSSSTFLHQLQTGGGAFTSYFPREIYILPSKHYSKSGKSRKFISMTKIATIVGLETSAGG
jgi:hypothetical protein